MEMDPVARIEAQSVHLVFDTADYAELLRKPLTRGFLTMCTGGMTENTDWVARFPVDALPLLDVALGLESWNHSTQPSIPRKIKKQS